MWAYGWGSKRHRGLRVWVLQLLGRGPMNGAEIMEEMDRMTMGWWRPSPGSIYPLLEQLVEEKLVRKRDDGRYEVTEAARRGPDWTHGPMQRGPRTPQDALAEMESYLAFLEDLGSGGRANLSEFVPRLKAVSKRLDDLAGRASQGSSP
ncbi:MAG: PadR family transcriptional regulator [Thermoplasmata archaeon]|nr:PadR family transcriptional regulator [Thermoplasmata archaeon]